MKLLVRPVDLNKYITITIRTLLKLKNLGVLMFIASEKVELPGMYLGSVYDVDTNYEKLKTLAITEV
jgi:hypothetical protein